MNNSMNTESFLMKIMSKLGFVRIAWSLRRLHCPVGADSLVLEVGSGASPYFRSNVLLDAYENTQQRHWTPLVNDRPTVLGAVECLPFRDKCFDFVIASHVLEHSSRPDLFLKELQRVSKAGYIEVPDALMERLNPYRDHRLEVTVRGSKLLIRKKADWINDSELVELFEAKAKKWISGETIPRHPFDFHVRFYWEQHINYEVLNSDVDADWCAPSELVLSKKRASIRSLINSYALQVLRAIFSQKRRNAQINLADLLACTECRGTELNIGGERIICRTCGTVYPIRNGMPVMFTKT